jgi:hypothetical protein
VNTSADEAELPLINVDSEIMYNDLYPDHTDRSISHQDVQNLIELLAASLLQEEL